MLSKNSLFSDKNLVVLDINLSVRTFFYVGF